MYAGLLGGVLAEELLLMMEVDDGGTMGGFSQVELGGASCWALNTTHILWFTIANMPGQQGALKSVFYHLLYAYKYVGFVCVCVCMCVLASNTYFQLFALGPGFFLRSNCGGSG